jgi:hypothetical protein
VKRGATSAGAHRWNDSGSVRAGVRLFGVKNTRAKSLWTP